MYPGACPQYFTYIIVRISLCVTVGGSLVEGTTIKHTFDKITSNAIIRTKELPLDG